MSGERPRAAVRSHLRHLMAATAVLGLAAATTRPAGSAPAAGKSDAGVGGDAGKDAAREAGGDAASVTTVSGMADASIDGDVDAEGPIPVEPCPDDGRRDSNGRCLPGYGVVDPLPPPSRGGCGCHKEPGMASGPDPDPVE